MYETPPEAVPILDLDSDVTTDNTDPAELLRIVS